MVHVLEYTVFQTDNSLFVLMRWPAPWKKKNKETALCVPEKHWLQHVEASISPNRCHESRVQRFACVRVHACVCMRMLCVHAHHQKKKDSQIILNATITCFICLSIKNPIPCVFFPYFKIST